MCKILEGCIRDHIVEHMVAHNIVSKQHFGFIEDRSTVLKLFSVLRSWTKALESQARATYFRLRAR